MCQGRVMSLSSIWLKNDFVTIAFDILYFQEWYHDSEKSKKISDQLVVSLYLLYYVVISVVSFISIIFISMLPSKCTGNDPEDNKMVTS